MLAPHTWRCALSPSYVIGSVPLRCGMRTGDRFAACLLLAIWRRLRPDVQHVHRKRRGSRLLVPEMLGHRADTSMVLLLDRGRSPVRTHRLMGRAGVMDLPGSDWSILRTDPEWGDSATKNEGCCPVRACMTAGVPVSRDKHRLTQRDRPTSCRSHSGSNDSSRLQSSGARARRLSGKKSDR